MLLRRQRRRTPKLALAVYANPILQTWRNPQTSNLDSGSFECFPGHFESVKIEPWRARRIQHDGFSALQSGDRGAKLDKVVPRDHQRPVAVGVDEIAIGDYQTKNRDRFADFAHMNKGVTGTD